MRGQITSTSLPSCQTQSVAEDGVRSYRKHCSSAAWGAGGGEVVGAAGWSVGIGGAILGFRRWYCRDGDGGDGSGGVT